MANVIDILINAAWSGGPAVTQAGQDLRSLSDNAAASSIEMAAVQASSSLLNQEMARLGKEVALGNLTVGEATQQYQAFSGSLATVETQAPKTGANIGGIATKLFAVTAAIGGASIAVNKLYGLLKSSAEIELTERRFDRLAQTIGTTGEALRTDIGIAARGLVSDFDAMALGTDLLALGLAKSHDEAVRLSSVSAQLGFNLNELVLTLTNQTTRRFDQLGVSVDGFKEKVETLEAAGNDANEAFKLAFLEQAEEQLDRIGGRADETAGKIDIIEAAWSNTLNTIKEGAIEDLGPVVDLLASATVAAGEAEAAVAEFAKSSGDVGKQAEAVERLRTALSDLSRGTAVFGLDYSRSVSRAESALLDLAVEVSKSGDTFDEQKAILEEFGFEIDKQTGKLDGITFTWKDFQAAVDEVDMARLVAEAESADRAMGLLKDTEDDVVESTSALAEEMEELRQKVEALDFQDFLDRAEISDETFTRLAYSLGGSAEALEYLKLVMKDAGQVTDDLTISAEELNDALEAQQDANQERARLWLDFQTDLTDISVREGERREELETKYESQRSEIVKRYGEQRTQEEEDFQRARARVEAKYLGQIAETQADSAERQEELRARSNDRLADLERDHLKRMQDIIDDADIQLAEAAGRLDAAAVTAIQRQRERALESEQQSYADSRDDIQRSLEQQLQAERDAAAERLAELQEFHTERLRIEDEDRSIRLAREQAAHDDRINQLEAQQTERLNLLETQAEEERAARNDQYEQFWVDRDGIEQEKMDAILAAERLWWQEREGLIPTAENRHAPSGEFGSNVAAGLPSDFFQSVNQSNLGGVTINISGAESPEATGDEVANRLIELFETFNR